MGKNKNKIGFKVDNLPVKAKSGKGKPKAKTGKTLGFKGGANGYSSNGGVKTYTYPVKKTLKKPIDTKRSDKLVFVFFDGKTLNTITEMCLPRAGTSEFQVHYRSLAVHIEKDGFEVVFSIPTSFYNFDQEVSTGSVDYELDDIDNEAEKVKEASNKVASDILTQIPFFGALKQMGYSVSFKEGNFGSIHRHPGRFGFSSIDLGKDPESPGVIYRQKNTKDFYQTDSVMYIDGTECEIYTTETRIVNLKPADDGGVDGDYCQTPTISIIKPEAVEGEDKIGPEKVLGDVASDIFSKFHFVGAFGAEMKKYPMLEIILEMLYSMDYQPDISNVEPNRIEQAYSYLKRGKYSYGSKKGSKKDDVWGYLDDWDDWDYGYGSLYGYGEGSYGYGTNHRENTQTSKNKDEEEVYSLAGFDDGSDGEWMFPIIESMIESHGLNATEEDIKEIYGILNRHFDESDALFILDYGTNYGDIIAEDSSPRW